MTAGSRPLARRRVRIDYTEATGARVLIPRGRGRRLTPRSGATPIRSLLLLAALALGACSGLIDLRSSGFVPVALVLAVAAFALAAIRPANAWLYALVMALCVPLMHSLAPVLGLVDSNPPHPNVAAALLAVVPALAGALLGVFARGVVTGPSRRPRSG